MWKNCLRGKVTDMWSMHFNAKRFCRCLNWGCFTKLKSWGENLDLVEIDIAPLLIKNPNYSVCSSHSQLTWIQRIFTSNSYLVFLSFFVRVVLFSLVILTTKIFHVILCKFSNHKNGKFHYFRTWVSWIFTPILDWLLTPETIWSIFFKE